MTNQQFCVDHGAYGDIRPLAKTHHAFFVYIFSFPICISHLALNVFCLHCVIFQFYILHLGNERRCEYGLANCKVILQGEEMNLPPASVAVEPVETI